MKLDFVQCVFCQKSRDYNVSDFADGVWQERSIIMANTSHGWCPACLKQRVGPELYEQIREEIGGAHSV